MMHRVLKGPEILLNIFTHFNPLFVWMHRSTLVALARTCRTFKEPALDVLWGELIDPSPLARCLPEAYRHRETSSGNRCYSFTRPLTQTEWDILRSYTRRILSMADYQHELDWESVGVFLNPPTTQSLFPNLRHLCCNSETPQTGDMLSLPFPSLISLDITFANVMDLCVLLGPLTSLCPNIRKLWLRSCREDITFNYVFCHDACQWQNLQTVHCPSVLLDVNALALLSRMPALTHLNFKLNAPLLDQITSTDLRISFSSLRSLELSSNSLDQISKLLSQIRLPAIMDFTVEELSVCPRKQDLSSFLDVIQTSGIGHFIQGLSLAQPGFMMYVVAGPVLGFGDLRLCMAFSNLRRIDVDLKWKVDLTDRELLALASAWPRLKCLLINKSWGWNTSDGITPNGLAQLLQTCRSLNWIALAMNTQGYTEFVPSVMSLRVTLPLEFTIDVVDSAIKPESVPAMAAFFASIAPGANFSLLAWRAYIGDTANKDRWHEVHTLAKEVIRQRW